MTRERGRYAGARPSPGCPRCARWRCRLGQDPTPVLAPYLHRAWEEVPAEERPELFVEWLDSYYARDVHARILRRMTDRATATRGRVENAATAAGAVLSLYLRPALLAQPELRRILIGAASSIIAETTTSGEEASEATVRIPASFQKLEKLAGRREDYTLGDLEKVETKEFLAGVAAAVDARLACRRF